MSSIIAIIIYSGAYPINDLRLNVNETLALIPQQEVRFVGNDRRNNWFRCANAEANPELVDQYKNAEFIQRKITIASILGYTGTEAEAAFLIRELETQLALLHDANYKEVKGDKYLLMSLFKSLGNMGRRGNTTAQKFLRDVARNKRLLKVSDATSSMLTPIWAVGAYAFLEPRDLETCVESVLERIPGKLHAYATQYDYHASFRETKKLEAAWIWGYEYRQLRKKTAVLKTESRGPAR